MPEVDACSSGLRLHLMEIDHGAFRRTVNLPPDVNDGGISAEYRGGLLRIRLPKT